MCGFLGVLAPDAIPDSRVPELRRRSQRLSTRGNTSRGEFVEGKAAFFHYRLAFRDLTAGDQPMRDPESGRVLVYNGELYDFRRLRATLDYSFRTDSDTELFLGLYADRAEDLTRAIDGEYAFGIWDPAKNRLVLGRDPYGVKPLFFSAQSLGGGEAFRRWSMTYDFEVQGEIAFASEMKGLPWNLTWDRAGFERQFTGLFEEIATPFREVIQVPPGAILIAEKSGTGWKCRIERKVMRRREPKPAQKISFADAGVELAGLVRKAVAERLDADVPLGAYLSGGVDSRVVAQLMLERGYAFDSFTVGFEGADYDESESVRAFLRERPQIHGSLLRTTNAALDYAYPIAIFSSEIIQPYTNGSAKWWLSRFARRKVRGVLTGDGADEVFCGYPSYRYVHWWDFYDRQPSEKRRSAYARYLSGEALKPWEAGLSNEADGRDLESAQENWGWAFPLYAQVNELSRLLFGEEKTTSWMQAKGAEIQTWVAKDSSATALTRWQNYFLQTNFPTHVLNWVGDRMEMANTLEGRPPFLAKSILDWISDKPDHFFVRGFQEKAILRKAFSAELTQFAKARKKQFNAPFLLDSPLARRMLAPEMVKKAGLVAPESIEAAKRELHLSQNPLKKSFAQIFLQNTIVTHMLHEYLVEGLDPERDHAWEENFMDERTEVLS